MKKTIILILILLVSLCNGINKYVCHPDGNDLNGGGFLLTSETVTWSSWHSSFAPVKIQAGCTISDNGGGKCRLTSIGNLSSLYKDILVYCDFSATYTDDRYMIIAADANYIDIDLAFDVNVPTADVRIGGAVKSPKLACTLGNTTTGEEVLFPCNQTTQTINEVDGTANAINMSVENATLNIYGVDEATGIAITSEDSNDWPVIQAKTESTWTDNTGMFTSTAALCYSKVDKILFDGNNIVPRVIFLDNDNTDYCILQWGRVEIKSSKSDGYGCLINGYTELNSFSIANADYGIKKLKIDDCHIAFFPVSRQTCPISELWLDGNHYGIYSGTSIIAINQIRTVILSNHTIAAIRVNRYDSYIRCCMTFINNAIDLKVDAYSTINYIHNFYNSVFWNSSPTGKILEVDNDTYVDVGFYNCVFGDVNDASDMSRFSGITPTRIDCEYIQADPFMDSANGDYRLNPAFPDLSKIYDWTKQVNNIGATSVAEPVSNGSGNGGSIMVTED